MRFLSVILFSCTVLNAAETKLSRLDEVLKKSEAGDWVEFATATADPDGPPQVQKQPNQRTRLRITIISKEGSSVKYQTETTYGGKSMVSTPVSVDLDKPMGAPALTMIFGCYGAIAKPAETKERIKVKGKDVETTCVTMGGMKVWVTSETGIASVAKVLTAQEFEGCSTKKKWMHYESFECSGSGKDGKEQPPTKGF